MDAKKPSEILAEQVGRWRRRRELTVEQLAARVAELDGKMGRVTLTKLENRDRGVSLDEALLLAAALNVPPAILFFGLEREPRVKLASKAVIHPDLASQWLAGTAPLASTERLAMGSAEWYEAAATLRLYEKLHDAQDSAHTAEAAEKTAEYAGDDAQIQRTRKRVAERLQDLADVLNEMHRAGLRPPKLNPASADRMAKLGMKVEG